VHFIANKLGDIERRKRKKALTQILESLICDLGNSELRTEIGVRSQSSISGDLFLVAVNRF